MRLPKKLDSNSPVFCLAQQTPGAVHPAFAGFAEGSPKKPWRLGLLPIHRWAVFLCALAAVNGLPKRACGVTLAWNPSPDPTVTGYFLYFGGASGTYTNKTDRGFVTNAVINGLVNGDTYFFAVSAYDSAGLESLRSAEVSYTVPAPNPPVVAVSSPANGTRFAAPANIGLAAALTSNGHTISAVQFYSHTNLLAQVSSAPYAFTWTNVVAGAYALSAVAIYDAGAAVTSAPVNINVTNAVVVQPPAVALSAPVDSASYTAPANIDLAAALTSNGHTISAVQFYSDTNLLAQVSSAPYAFTWTNVGPGAYALSAVAVYDAGASATSGPVNIIVTNPVVAGLPAPWQAADIGTGQSAGSAVISNDVYTVSGAGTLSRYSDTFQFLYQILTGDGQITIQVLNAGNAGSRARVGIMIRENLTSSSRYVFMGVSPGGAFRWQRRSSTGGSTRAGTYGTGTFPNVWIKIVRTGDTFAGYESSDGVSWSSVASANISMATNAFIGLAVCSGASNVLDAATFTGTTVVP